MIEFNKYFEVVGYAEDVAISEKPLNPNFREMDKESILHTVAPICRKYGLSLNADKCKSTNDIENNDHIVMFMKHKISTKDNEIYTTAHQLLTKVKKE